MIYKDILYTLYELRFQGDQTPFQDSNFKKTLWVFQHLLVLLLTCSDKCALITWTVVAKNWTKKCVLQGNRISARLLTSFHLAMANLTLLHLLWGDALLTALNRLDCSRFQCSPQWSIYYAYHTKVFIMSNIYLPCSKSSLLVFVLSHNEKNHHLSLCTALYIFQECYCITLQSFVHWTKTVLSILAQTLYLLGLWPYSIALTYLKIFVLVLTPLKWCVFTELPES